MAAHSSTLAWKVPWMEEPGRLQSMGSQRVGHVLSDFTFTFHFHALEKEMATHSSVLAWRIPGTGEPDGLPSMGSHRVGHDWSDIAAAAAANYLVSFPTSDLPYDFLLGCICTPQPRWIPKWRLLGEDLLWLGIIPKILTTRRHSVHV